jgi:hypothetical protein
VRSIRIGPDGKHLASGDRAGNIRWGFVFSRTDCLHVWDGHLFKSRGFAQPPQADPWIVPSRKPV